MSVHRYVICRIRDDQRRLHTPPSSGWPQYDIRQLFGNETYEEIVQSGEVESFSMTVFKRDGVIIDTAGEFCGEFSDKGQASIEKHRLEMALEVMES